MGRLLRNECATFTHENNDSGCADGLSMAIELKDQVPVHTSLMDVPKPFLYEVKENVNNLLSKQWIYKSTSQYTSPVVCVRKRIWISPNSRVQDAGPKQSLTAMLHTRKLSQIHCFFYTVHHHYL